MAKDPAFLFYPGDWLGGTMGMTLEQKGAYLELLIYQFNKGKFTLAQAKQVLSICFANVWEVVSTKFKNDGEYYWNERLDAEISKRKAFTESRRTNALSGSYTNKSKKKKTKSKSKAYAKHMENENENENRDEIEDENKGVQGGKIQLPFNSETFKRAWTGWKYYKREQHKFTFKGEHTEQIALKKLAEDSGNNEQIALQIIEQSIANGWKGLFKLKINSNGQTTKLRNPDGSVNWAEVNRSADEFLAKQGLG